MPVFTSANGASKQNSSGKKMMFCPYCGTKLDDGARFCKNCGEAVLGNNDNSRKSQYEEHFGGNPTERKTVYEGYLHKCPTCGEVLEAFTTICPSCGHEIRDAKTSTSVRELALKLESIAAQKMPSFEEKKSVMKMIFGKDFKEENEADEALKRFESQKQQEMASLIVNFSVPNTKEDILEFMILAASNIDVRHGVDDDVTKAWIVKLDQVYQKAKISMGRHPDFAKIETIYNQKKQELKKRKIRNFLIGAGCVAGWFFLLGLLWNPAATIGIAVGVLVLIVIGVFLFKRR